MSGMAVFETPPPPEGWISRNVIRIVDPLGTAIAWIDASLAGACVGFSVREGPGRPWRQILRSDPPERTADDGRLGLAPMLEADALRPVDAPDARWTMLERDPTGVTVGSVDAAEEHRVVVECDEHAVEMTLIGAGFAGVRLDLAVGNNARWVRTGPGRLVGGTGVGTVTIDHSPGLRSRSIGESGNRSDTHRIALDATGEKSPGDPLFVRVSASGFEA